MLLAALRELRIQLERHFILRPRRQIGPWPTYSADQLFFTEVHFTNDAGNRLHGIVGRPRSFRVPHYWVLFCHGNSVNIADGFPWYSVFAELGLSIFAFDYRGYGRSQGTPSELGLYRDVAAAYRYLLSEHSLIAGDVIVYGHSLGASLAVDLASREPLAGLVIEAALPSIECMLKEMHPKLPLYWLTKSKFDTMGTIHTVMCPKLLFHGTDDCVVRLSHGERLFAQAAPPKEWCRLMGGHSDAIELDRETALCALQQFLYSIQPG
jgi:fermentation-respiration switch protein FrsA (DUF1100 family)